MDIKPNLCLYTSTSSTTIPIVTTDSSDSIPNKVLGTHIHLSRYSKNVLKEPVLKDRKVLAYLWFDITLQFLKGSNFFFYVIQTTSQLSNLFHNSGINFVYASDKEQVLSSSKGISAGLLSYSVV